MIVPPAVGAIYVHVRGKSLSVCEVAKPVRSLLFRRVFPRPFLSSTERALAVIEALATTCSTVVNVTKGVPS